MNQHRITPLTESGLLAAITVVLALAAVYLPVVGMIAALIWALPIVILVVRHGWRWGIMAVFVAGIIMALVIEPMVSLRMVLSFAPTGLILGLGFRKAWSGAKTFGLALLASLAGKISALALLFAVTAINPLTSQMDVLKEAFTTSLEVYADMGVDAATLQQSQAEITQAMSMLALLLPLVVMMMGLVDTVIGYMVSSRVLRRLGHSVREFPPFGEWRLPKFFLYLFGFALVGLYWGGTRHIDLLYQAALNANMLAIFAGLVQGLALAHCIMRHFKLNVLVRTIIYIMIVMNGFLAQLVAMTGLIDMIFDYRRRFAAQLRK